MKEKKSIDPTELLENTALKYHKKYEGKLQILPKCPIHDHNDFSYWYTPGVTKPSRVISKDKDQSFNLTNRWNSIAIVTDGTRVLGLGDIGPEAALPVMEGKALLFKYLGGIDAFPICVDTRDPKQILKVTKWIMPTFGGINFEDIEKPKCFHILDEARKYIGIPVWHDDQQGTATVILAGIINALKIVSKKIEDVQIGLIGAGAANLRTDKLLVKAGAKAGNIFVVDSKGILNQNRRDLEVIMKKNPLVGKWKWELCLTTNKEEREGGIADALKGTDICIAASRPGPGIIKKEWIKEMSENPIIFACANPIPEIWPDDAKEAGAKIVATGRTDFPNQINNMLAFPGIFRGVLDVRAKTITDDMCVVAAKEMASFAEERGISEENIVPNMDEWMVFVKIASACALNAIEQNLAKIKLSKNELENRALSIIKNSRDSINLLMEKKIIADLDH
jgi:malate dehydrogenase (oxaloacetate-decarboxylating)